MSPNCEMERMSEASDDYNVLIPPLQSSSIANMNITDSATLLHYNLVLTSLVVYIALVHFK